MQFDFLSISSGPEGSELAVLRLVVGQRAGALFAFGTMPCACGDPGCSSRQLVIDFLWTAFFMKAD